MGNLLIIRFTASIDGEGSSSLGSNLKGNNQSCFFFH
jgi:hypothetical protein